MAAGSPPLRPYVLQDFRVQRRLLFLDLGVEESRRKIDPDQPAVLGQLLEQVVRQVPVEVGQGAAAGVRGHDRRAADPHHIPEGLVVSVGNVDDHAQRIHLLDDFLAEFGQAAPRGLGISRGVRPAGPCPVGERHQPDARPVKSPQQVEVVLDGVAALDPDEHGRLSGIPEARRVLVRLHDFQVTRVLADQAINRLDLVE